MKLTLAGICRTYGGRTVLSDCSFSFAASGVYTLMGPNGSGKSTLLRICAMLEQPDSGTLDFVDDGAPLRHDLSLKRRITLVLPRVGAFNTSVYRNAAYGLKVRGAAPRETQDRVKEVLAFVGLQHKAQQQARSLSSGETQRLGIARALVIRPEIIFLDEPTASVDRENTAIIEGIIRTMGQDGHTSVIMTTHDRDQAERLADVMIELQDGRLEVRRS